MQSRRTFLTRASASVLAAKALVQTAMAQQPRPIKVGFLGTAHSHFKGKLAVVEESAEWQLAGLCEENEAIRAHGPRDANWLSANELFAKSEVIVVESAVQDHARDAKRALLAGKHVYVEKPPAETLKGLRELLSLAKERRRIFQIGYMWRYNPGINAVLDAARRGWLGEVYLVRATMNTLVGPEQRRDWARFQGGAMFEQGCHLIDPLVRLLGKPSRVDPFLKRTSADGLADNCVAVFGFPNALGIVTSAPLQPNAGPQRFFEVLGTNGTARVQPLEPPALTVDLGKAAGPYSAGRQEVKLPGYRRYVDEFVALASAIRQGTPLPVTSAVELMIQEALLRACKMK